MSLALCLALALVAPPEIARTQGASARVIFGVNFVPGATEVRGTELAYDLQAALLALRPLPYPALAMLPSTPPDEARRIPILDADPRGLAITVDFGERAPEVLWVKNADGWSKPALVDAPQPWWLFPDAAAPGERVRLFGRDLDLRAVAFKPRADEAVVAVTTLAPGRQSAHEVAFNVPDTLAPGVYDVWTHNGRGGLGGWTGPLALTVRPAQRANTLYTDIRSFGAKGNGLTDDTAAFRRALTAAQRDRAVLCLSPGLYLLRGTLDVPAGVEIQGAGAANSLLAVTDRAGFEGEFPARPALEGPAADAPREPPLLVLHGRNRLAQLGLQSAPGILVLAAGEPAEDIVIDHCTLRGGASIRLLGDTSRFVLRDCDLAGPAGLTCWSASNRQAHLARNEFRGLPAGRGELLALRGLHDSVVEDNLLRDGSTLLNTPLGPALASAEVPAGGPVPLASIFHVAFLGNDCRDAEPAPTTAPAPYWTGHPLRADDERVFVADAPFAAVLRDAWVAVTEGRGVGQYRRVTANAVNMLAVAPAWDVLPDAGSTLVVSGAVAENLWLDQRAERCPGLLDVRALAWGNVWSGGRLRACGPAALSGATVAYNTLRGLRFEQTPLTLGGLGNLLAGCQGGPITPGLAPNDWCAVVGQRGDLRAGTAAQHLVSLRNTPGD